LTLVEPPDHRRAFRFVQIGTNWEVDVASHDHDEEQRVTWAREIALFRYTLIREAADPTLSTRARGRLVRQLAAGEHVGASGRRLRVSRATIDRWIRDWRAGGFDALVPAPRTVAPRSPAEALATAVALKTEVPARTAAQVAAVLRAATGWSPSERTLQRHFAAAGLNIRPDGSPPQAFGRFEAERPNQLWVGDALHGPTVADRKTYLLAFLDDHSRAVVGYRWTHAEDTIRLEGALRAALAARGVPATVYVDNGSAFVDRQLERACAVLGIRLVHSRPGRPQGRGKIERFFGTVRGQFLVEADAPGPDGTPRGFTDLGALNEAFTAWVETVYHRRTHSETGHPPIDRFLAAGPPTPPPAALLREAFLWSEWRTVTKTATVSLHANTYQVDPALVGHRVQLLFDPFDLTRIDVRYHGRSTGQAIPHRIGRHVHPKARPDTVPPPPAPTTSNWSRPNTEPTSPTGCATPTSTPPTTPPTPPTTPPTPPTTRPTSSRHREHRPAGRLLRFHPHPLRPHPRPRHAPPPPLPRRGGRPHPLAG
jgi:putative transposase